MPIRYNNQDNRILKGTVPLGRVMKGTKIVYGEVKTYNLLYTETIGCSAITIKRTGMPGYAGGESTFTCSGESKNYIVYDRDTLSLDSFTPTTGYNKAEVTFTPSNVVTQDVVLNIGVNPKPYTLTFPNTAEGCDYVTVHREGTATSGDITLTPENNTGTVYYDDILTIVDIGTPSGYSEATVSVGEGPVTGNRTMTITPHPNPYVVRIPSIPTGVQVRYRKNGGTWSSFSASTSEKEINVGFDDEFDIQVCALAGYKIPTSSLTEEGSSLSASATTFSATSTCDDVSVSAIRTTVYSVVIGATNYELNIGSPEAVASYNLTPTYGTTLDSSKIYYVASPYSKAGTTGDNIETTASSTIIVYDEAKSLMADSILFSIEGTRAEGYKLNSITVGAGGTFALQRGVSIVADTTAGVPCTIVYPTFPTGVTGVEVERTSTIYSRSTGSPQTLVTEGGTLTSFGSAYNCYVGDVITITATRASFYDKPTIGITGDVAQTLSKSNIELTSDNITMVIQAGERAQTATFICEPTEGVGYWEFELTSKYYNSGVISSQSGGTVTLSPGTYVLCAGDVITQVATNGRCARISLTEYRSPGLTMTEGSNTLYTNERGNVEIIIEANKTYTCSYVASTVLANGTGSQSINFYDGNNRPYSNRNYYIVVDGVAERKRVTGITLNYTSKRYLGDLVSSKYQHKTYALPQNDSFSITWRGTGIGAVQSKSGAIKGNSSWDITGFEVIITSTESAYITNIGPIDVTYTY